MPLIKCVRVQKTADWLPQPQIGAKLAKLELEIGGAPFPPLSMENAWGGARNRTGRVSHSLRPDQADKLLAAAERAWAIGLPLNRMITIHWEAAGVPDAGAAKATGRYIKLLSDWTRMQGGRLAWLWVRENDCGDGSKGSHVHILMHIPRGLPFARMQRRWLRKVAGRCYCRGTVDTQRIGGRAEMWRTSPELYRANLLKVLAYVLKGRIGGAAILNEFHGREAGGRIIGKRCGRSENLGDQDGPERKR